MVGSHEGGGCDTATPMPSYRRFPLPPRGPRCPRGPFNFSIQCRTSSLTASSVALSNRCAITNCAHFHRPAFAAKTNSDQPPPETSMFILRLTLLARLESSSVALALLEPHRRETNIA